MTKKRVIELIRVSTEEQAADSHASIPAQRAVNRRTCAQYGLEIVRSIEIADVSGANVLNAPEMRSLVQAIKSSDIHGVVAREFSRLMRPENLGDFQLLQDFAESQTILYLPEGPIDLSNKMGKLMGGIRALMAGLERTEILERIWSAKEEKRRAGKNPNSNVTLPFGVGYDEQRGWHYKPEAEKVREAFRRFLSGNHNYKQLAELVGVTPRGMYVIFRNPIWCGWRVYDKRRDTTAAGRYQGRNGRQADRRKVERTADEVIRVKVIDNPVVTEAEFQAVQQMMDVKVARHWRSQPDYHARFVYNGFLTCSLCGSLVHTGMCGRDYYACSGRRHKGNGCTGHYMQRERLEETLDKMFAQKLTDPDFIQERFAEWEQEQNRNETAANLANIRQQMSNLKAKRERVVSSFVDGVIDGSERDKRIAEIDRDMKAYGDILLRTEPAKMDVNQLAGVLRLFVAWASFDRQEKRELLSVMVPEIRVANYQVESIGLNSACMISHSNENTRREMGTHIAEPQLVYFPMNYGDGIR